MFHIWTLLEAFVKMSLRSVFVSDEFFFLVNTRISSPGTNLLKCQIIRIFVLQDTRLMEFCCTIAHSFHQDMCESYPVFQKLKS